MDNSFVSRVMQSAEDAIIVQSTIASPITLGLTVVGRRVEDSSTLQFLELHGCDFAQGYGIAHPLPLAETISWLRSVARPPAAHHRHDLASRGMSLVGINAALRALDLHE